MFTQIPNQVVTGKIVHSDCAQVEPKPQSPCLSVVAVVVRARNLRITPADRVDQVAVVLVKQLAARIRAVGQAP